MCFWGINSPSGSVLMLNFALADNGRTFGFPVLKYTSFDNRDCWEGGGVVWCFSTLFCTPLALNKN